MEGFFTPLGFGLSFCFDGFRVVYALIATIMWICSTLLSHEYFSDRTNIVRYYVFSAMTYLATVGVFLSGDLFTTFCFFEVMSIASYAYVAHTEKKEALRAAETYLAVAIIGGLVMLMGLMMLNNLVGTLDMMELKSACKAVLNGPDPSGRRELFWAGGCILFGFGAKAGMFPLHIWLPKAHPVAPAPASALLSGILTKSGVFGVLVLVLEVFTEEKSFGLVVVFLGVLTMLTGAVLAVFSVDLKRTLACSSVSQIGFILIGAGLIPLLGEECTLAVSGTMLYMVNHSAFKLLLFLSAGIIYMKCHMLNLNDLRGYGRDMNGLKIIFLIGALGISGVPLFSGYIAKTLIHEGIVEYIAVSEGSLLTVFKIIEWLFLISGGMTFAYMTKLFFAVFVDKPAQDCKYAGKDKECGFINYVAVGIPALAIVVFGTVPGLFIRKLAVAMSHFNTFSFNTEQLEHINGIRIFSLENLKGSLISISFGIVFFVLIRRFLTVKHKDGTREYLDVWPARLDLEELVYRPLLCGILPFLFGTVGRFIATDLCKYIWKFIMKAGEIVAHAFADLFACFVGLLQKNVFTELKAKRHTKLERVSAAAADTERKLKIVSAGISYGMMFICLGLCITMFYLLYLLFA